MFAVEFYDANGLIDHNATVASLEELEELAQDRPIRITGRGTLSHNEAMEVIDAYRIDNGLAGTLETLEDMKIAKFRGQLTHRQRHAFDVIFKGFQTLFYGDEA